MLNPINKTIELADGRTITIETGKLAKQADGAVTVRMGNTVLLATVCAAKDANPGVDFMPLQVEYKEKFSAFGRFPGGFTKREGRASDYEILTCRLVDRALRPLFPDNFHAEVYVNIILFSADGVDMPDALAGLAASAALAVSDIPFNGPISEVRVGRINGEFVINPTVEQAKVSLLNLAVAGTKDAILMVEAGAKEVSEETMLDAIWFAHGVIKELVAFQEKIMAEVGKPKMEVPVYEPPAEIAAEIEAYGADKLKEALMDANKLEREENVAKVKAEIAEVFIEKYPDNAKDVAYITQKLVKKIVRRTISVDKIRPDGRQLDEVRPVTCEVGLLARPHGSALFTRGQTQILNVLALAPLREAQILDGLGVEDTKRYIHHYNFPPYSVGETKPMRSPGRREIGHGALAERALLPVIPSEDEFPYAIRLVSETLESNGSSSMGSVCASTLSLMDAGVPIKAPVAGVAMGLVKDGEYFTILTDIQGLEDALGDMDFKVAGTDKGITAIQMDIKIDGINKDIFTQALAQAKRGRDHIMGIMMECISEPRKELSQYAPKITTISVDPEKISKVIGPGGKMIKKIVEETGAKIDIDDSGKVFIAAVNSESAAKAIDMIHGIVADAEVGKVYTGKVTRLMNFGAFVEILPGKEGLVHISQLSTERVGKVEDVVSVGDEIVVKVTEIDQKGRINLSRKAVLANGLEK